MTTPVHNCPGMNATLLASSAHVPHINIAENVSSVHMDNHGLTGNVISDGPAYNVSQSNTNTLPGPRNIHR